MTCAPVSVRDLAAAGDVSIVVIRADREDALGSWIEVNCDNWLLKDSREIEQIDSCLDWPDPMKSLSLASWSVGCDLIPSV
jgi:hypothetical protein